MKKVLLLTSVLVLLLACFAEAAMSTNAKVVHAGTFGDGRLFVLFDTEIKEPGCFNKRLDVAAGHDQIKTWLSVALAAMLTGKEVNIRSNGCLGSTPTLDNTTASSFWLRDTQ